MVVVCFKIILIQQQFCSHFSFIPMLFSLHYLFIFEIISILHFKYYFSNQKKNRFRWLKDRVMNETVYKNIISDMMIASFRIVTNVMANFFPVTIYCFVPMPLVSLTLNGTLGRHVLAVVKKTNNVSQLIFMIFWILLRVGSCYKLRYATWKLVTYFQKYR